MRKLFLASLIIFTIYFSAYGQNASKCPTFHLLNLENEVIDGKVTITAVADNDSGEYAGNIEDGISFKEKHKFKWKFSPDIEFTAEKPWIAKLKNISKSDKLDLSAIVEIEGLPTNCQSIFTESFKLGFYTPPVGDPIHFDIFEKLSISDEKKRFDIIASAFKNECLKEKNACFMTIILYHSPDKPQEVKTRMKRISGYLTTKHKIPKSSYKYVGGGKSNDGYMTEIWFIPSFANLPNNK